MSGGASLPVAKRASDAAGEAAGVTDHARQRADMVRRQLAARGIADEHVLRAMSEVPRHLFVPGDLREAAYDDRPLPIGEGQTISQPYIVARMIEAAQIRPGGTVLEVGAGSGYAAAVLSQIAAQVFAIERHEGLARMAVQRLADLGYANCRIISGDGSLGLPDEEPFDAILVAAGGDHAPEPLKRQLAIGGRLIIPVGGEDVQQLCRITRISPDEWEEADLGSVRFVPLIGAHGRWDEEN